MSDCLQPHELQHARPPCPSPTPGVHPLSQWCHPTTLSSVVSFSSCPQSFPASGSFTVSELFISGGQDTGALVSVLTMNIQGWFPLGLIPGLILLSQESLPAPQFKSLNSSVLSLLYGPTLTSVHDYSQNHSFDYDRQNGLPKISMP